MKKIIYQRLLYLLTNQIAHQGFWIFNWLTLPLDSEDGFRTGCRNADDLFQSRYVTPGFKPFSYYHYCYIKTLTLTYIDIQYITLFTNKLLQQQSLAYIGKSHHHDFSLVYFSSYMASFRNILFIVYLLFFFLFSSLLCLFVCFLFVFVCFVLFSCFVFFFFFDKV